MDDFEIAMRKRFYAETGKTPEQEATDSAKAAGLMVVVVAFVAAVGLIAYFW
jgi:hypothetical protein